jgi:hypothetical protein
MDPSKQLGATNTDASDPWDDVLLFEQRAFREGEREAEADTIEKFREGSHLGFLKGYEIGMELTYMVQVLRSDSLVKKSAHVSRMQETLLRRIDSVPAANTSDFDFAKEMDEIRALFRALSSSVGPLIASTTTSYEW